MWGMEWYQLFAFLRQLGLAVMTAACLWGLVFLMIAARSKISRAKSIFLSWIGLRLRWLVAGGGLLAFATWMVLLLMPGASAHEGVTLVTHRNDVITAMSQTSQLHIAIAVVVLIILVLYRRPSRIYAKKSGFSWLYFIGFVLGSIAISYYVDLTGLPTNEIVFHIFHGFHSVFTLGTVLCLDFLFLSTQKAPLVQKYVFPFFPQISKVIWAGFSLDLISTLLIYPEAVALTPRFYFAQIVVGILIINGVLLSGVLTRRILQNIEQGREERAAFWERFAIFSGAVSVTSWFSITFVDSFHDMTVSLEVLFLVYIVLIFLGILGHQVWNRYDKRAEQMKEIHFVEE
jgi:hypothetical protein